MTPQLPREIWMMILKQKQKNFRDRLYRYVEKLFWCFDRRMLEIYPDPNLISCQNSYVKKFKLSSINDQIETLICFWINKENNLIVLCNSHTYLSYKLSKRKDFRNKDYKGNWHIDNVCKIPPKIYKPAIRVEMRREYKVYKNRIKDCVK